MGRRTTGLDAANGRAVFQGFFANPAPSFCRCIRKAEFQRLSRHRTEGEFLSFLKLLTFGRAVGIKPLP
jgi:hypothetical protein